MDRKTGSLVVAVSIGLVMAACPSAEGPDATTRGGGPSTAASGPSTPEEVGASADPGDARTARIVRIARTFMAARNAHDAEAAMSMVAGDGVDALLMYRNRMVVPMGSVRLSLREVALAFDAERIYGVRYGDVECRADPRPGAGNVGCTYSMDSKLRRLAGLEPIGSAFRLGIRDGRIELLTFPWLNISWNPGGFYPFEVARFVSWLDDAHPDAVDAQHPMLPQRLFRTPGQEWILRLTPGTLRVLAAYVAEYEGR